MLHRTILAYPSQILDPRLVSTELKEWQATMGFYMVEAIDARVA